MTGHEVDSHSHNHKSIKAMTKSEIKNEIILSSNAIENAIGIRQFPLEPMGTAHVMN